MWLFKLKSMRPPEKWGKTWKGKTQNRKKTSRSKSATGPGEPQSDAGSPPEEEGHTPFESEQPNPNDQPFRVGGTGSDYDARNGSEPRERLGGAELQHVQPLQQQQSQAGQQPLDEQALQAALQRAIQASPPKFPGSQSASIDVEGDGSSPPVRRLLFPSPRKAGQMKTLQEVGAQQNNSVSINVSAASGVEDLTEQDKENTQPSQGRRASTPTNPPTKEAHAFKTPLRRNKTSNALSPDAASSGSTKLRRSPRFSPLKSKSPAKNPITPFTASMNQLLSDPPQSPTSFSDQFNMFGDAAFGDANDASFNFNEFTNDGYTTDLPMPQSDADYFPVLNEFDMNIENWDGGPLFDGELDALLQEANDNGCQTYFDNNGITEMAIGDDEAGATADGTTPGQQDGGSAA